MSSQEAIAQANAANLQQLDTIVNTLAFRLLDPTLPPELRRHLATRLQTLAQHALALSNE